MKGKDLLIVGTYAVIAGAIFIPLTMADKKLGDTLIEDLYDDPKYLNEDGLLNRKGKLALAGIYALEFGKGMANGYVSGNIGLIATRKIFKL